LVLVVLENQTVQVHHCLAQDLQPSVVQAAVVAAALRITMAIVEDPAEVVLVITLAQVEPEQSMKVTQVVQEILKVIDAPAAAAVVLVKQEFHPLAQPQTVAMV
jgi:hypothetical protein